MSEEIIFIPQLPDVDLWPTRKTPQDKFDSAVQTAMNQVSSMVVALNDEFIPAVNDIIDDVNIVLEERVNIQNVSSNMRSILDVYEDLEVLNTVHDNYGTIATAVDNIPMMEAVPTQLEITKSYYDQIMAVASEGVLTPGAFNIRKPFIVNEFMPAGSTLVLPAKYFPQRDTLLIGFNGTVCIPRKDNLIEQGEYQYTEVGDNTNVLSDEIIVHFDVPAGSVFDVWILASNIERNSAEAEEAARQAKESADISVEKSEIAKEKSASAFEYAVRAENAAARAEGVVGTGPRPEVHVVKQETDMSEGEILTTPEYTPDAGSIHVYYEGLILSKDVHYEETIADTGSGKAASIKILFDTKKDDLWEFHVWNADTETE